MRIAFPTAIALGIAFRPCRDDDLSFLARLYASTRAEEVAQTGWPAEAQHRFLAQQFDAQHRHYARHYPNAKRLVVERDGQPVGRVYVDEEAERLHLIDIALLPEARGRGIGGAILADLLREARGGGRTVAIYVEKHNRARHLYRRLGFVPIADEDVYDYREWRGAAVAPS
jgi:ribosomal protein S18 acetylase RimI-like enzyme